MSCNAGQVYVVVGRRIGVSIPIGFSNELQRGGPNPGRHPRPRFNPYRVFQ